MLVHRLSDVKYQHSEETLTNCINELMRKFPTGVKVVGVSYGVLYLHLRFSKLALAFEEWWGMRTDVYGLKFSTDRLMRVRSNRFQMPKQLSPNVRAVIAPDLSDAQVIEIFSIIEAWPKFQSRQIKSKHKVVPKRKARPAL